MNTIKSIQKSQIKLNEKILTNSHHQYQNNVIFNNAYEIQIITAIYLTFKIFRKIKLNFDINLRITGRNKK